MSSLPISFNSYGDDTNNNPKFPIHIDSTFRNQCSVARSVFTTSDHMNHGNLFSSSPCFTSYQNSNLSSSSSSSSFGLNNSHMMRRNTDSLFRAESIVPIKDNPRFSQVSFTQTVTNRFSAIVPTRSLFDIERVQRALESQANSWSTTTLPPPNFLDQDSQILNPTPLNVVSPQQEAAYRQQFDMYFSSPPNPNHDHHVPQYGPSLHQPTTFPRETIDIIDSDQEDEIIEEGRYDGRTHSLPYEKYGPYTCPKCTGVFDTSQKFAAHMSSHYRSETHRERDQRFRARNKNKFRKLKNKIHGESKKMKLDTGVSSVGVSDVEAFQRPVAVKKELV